MASRTARFERGFVAVTDWPTAGGPICHCHKREGLHGSDNGCTVGMKGSNGGRAPGLAFGTVGLSPDDRFPIWLKGKHALSNNLDAVATRLVGIEEEALGNRVFARRKFNEDTIFQVDISGPQHIFAVVEVISDVMQAAR